MFRGNLSRLYALKNVCTNRSKGVAGAHAVVLESISA